MMGRKKRLFSYAELMNALDGCGRKEMVSGVIVLALDSWNAKNLSNNAFSAILIKCADVINDL